MSVPQPVRRDMSYRKPVPKYVPSPPPSPRQNPPYNRQSLSMESTMYGDLPPLPSGWRDAIDRATSKEKWAFGGPMNRVEYDLSGSQTSVPAASRREQVSSPWMNDRSDSYSVSDYGDEALVATTTYARSWAQSPRTSRKRTLPLDYRPPTPPLSAYAKQGRFPYESSAKVFPSVDLHTIYPDPPSILDLNSILPRSIMDDKNLNDGRADLLPSASFQTETTQPSSATRPSSFCTRVNAPIPEIRETWLRETWCILPPLPNHRNSSEDLRSEEKGWRSPETSNQARRFWERLAMLGNLLRTRLRNFRAAPFSNCDCVSSISSAQI